MQTYFTYPITLSDGFLQPGSTRSVVGCFYLGD